MPPQSDWCIEFYADARGRSPVFDFIHALQGKDRAAMLRVIDLLQEFGPALRFPHASHVEGPLWELRGGAGRLFYFVYVGRRFIILHGYYKKSQKAPTREIETARRRWAEFLERENHER